MENGRHRLVMTHLANCFHITNLTKFTAMDQRVRKIMSR